MRNKKAGASVPRPETAVSFEEYSFIKNSKPSHSKPKLKEEKTLFLFCIISPKCSFARDFLEIFKIFLRQGF